MSDNFEDMRVDPERYWEARYQVASPQTSGRPGTVLRRFAEPLEPGRALELGCGKGDDAVWLARQGWSVTAVEISHTALNYVAANAERAGVSDRITLEQHDLSRSFPERQFDLVTASFLAAFPREPVFQRAAAGVASGGHLLIIDHGSRSHWSSAPAHWKFSTAEETLVSLQLKEADWASIHVGVIERHATGPKGETAIVMDNVIFLKRL